MKDIFKIIRTDSSHDGFKYLVKLLDQDLAYRDGNDHAFYDQFNKIEMIKNVVVVIHDKEVVACGALKKTNEADTMEVKRMYTLPSYRKKGMATLVLKEIEAWAKSLKVSSLRLETGIRYPEAIALYLKNGFEVVGNYRPYTNMKASRCFIKKIIE